MEHHGFPADETLAEFIDGRLDAEARQRVVEHLAECPECYDTFLTATEFAAISPEDAARGGEVVHGRFGRGAWYAAAAAIAVLAVGLITYRDTIGTRYDEFAFGRRTGMAKLVDVTQDMQYRPIEPRVSGGFAYKQPKPVYRSGSGESEDADYKTLLLTAEAKKLHDESQNASAKQHGAAVGSVLAGDVAAGAAALERILLAGKTNLRDAIASSDDKRLLNDLAAAWIVRSGRPEGEKVDEQEANRQNDLQFALAGAERALQLDPRYVEGAFNRALALERLERYDEAIKAWRTYQSIETDPRWREEAQRNIERAEDFKSSAPRPPR